MALDGSQYTVKVPGVSISAPTGGARDQNAFNAAAQRAEYRATQGAQDTLAGQTSSQLRNATNFYTQAAGIDPASGLPYGSIGAYDRIGIDQYGNLLGGGAAGNAAAQYDLSKRGAQEDYLFNIAGLNSRQAQLGIDQNALNRRLGTGGYFDQLQGLIGRTLANQLAGVDLQDLTAGHKRETARRGEISDATARGALQTYGTREDLHDIDKELMRQLRSGDISREGYRIGADKEKVSLAEQRAQDKDRQKSLAQTAKDYGLEGKQMETLLNRQLEQLGLDKYMTLNDLYDKASSQSAEDRAVFRWIAEQATANYSQFPVFSGDTRSTGGTSGGGAYGTASRFTRY